MKCNRYFRPSARDPQRRRHPEPGRHGAARAARRQADRREIRRTFETGKFTVFFAAALLSASVIRRSFAFCRHRTAPVLCNFTHNHL
jgi:hypothetical protein